MYNGFSTASYVASRRVFTQPASAAASWLTAVLHKNRVAANCRCGGELPDVRAPGPRHFSPSAPICRANLMNTCMSFRMGFDLVCVSDSDRNVLQVRVIYSNRAVLRAYIHRHCMLVGKQQRAASEAPTSSRVALATPQSRNLREPLARSIAANTCSRAPGIAVSDAAHFHNCRAALHCVLHCLLAHIRPQSSLCFWGRMAQPHARCLLARGSCRWQHGAAQCQAVVKLRPVAGWPGLRRRLPLWTAAQGPSSASAHWS